MTVDPLEAFRAEVAQWLAEHYPAILRDPQADPQVQAAAERDWHRRRAARGWLAPTWPVEYGGAGFDPEQARVLARELRRAGVRPPPISAGLSLLGPVLMARGSEAQKRRHLPGIARDEVRWCQGYSEPGAGSDLASLTTRAVLAGEHYVVDGQKIWTSHADQADWMFCLVRTDPEAPRHAGISFLLIDMKSPGIAVAPIRLISGPSAFCQTFFDAVRVPRENLVGEPGDGWAIARELLQHERRALGSIGRGDLGRARGLPELARRQLGEREGRIADPVLRAAVAQCELDSLALRLTMARAADEAAAGLGGEHVASLLKLWGSELTNRRHELMMTLLGADGLGWEGPGFDAADLRTTRQWLRAKGNSIEGGTNEIQRNLIAKRVLELPQ